MTSDSIELTINGRPVIDDVRSDAQMMHRPMSRSPALQMHTMRTVDKRLKSHLEFFQLEYRRHLPNHFENETDAIVDLSQTTIQAGHRLQCEVTVTDALGFDTSSTTNIIVGDTSVPHEPAEQ